MNLEDGQIGMTVLYKPWLSPEKEEFGDITRISDSHFFVLYYGSGRVQCTHPHNVEPWLTDDE